MRKWRRRGDLIGRTAEWTALHMGSARFLIGMTVFIALWFAINGVREFDPNFFLLNLIFSTMASYAAPLILLAQARVATRDQTALDHDRAVNRQAKADMEYLAFQINQLNTSLADLPTRRSIRDDVHALTDDLRDSQTLRQLVRRRRTSSS